MWVAKNKWELKLLSGKPFFISVSVTEQFCWVFPVSDAKKGVIQSYHLLPSCYLSKQRFQLSISKILQNLTNPEANIGLQTLWSDEQLSLYKLGNKITVTIYSMKLSMDIFCSCSEYAATYFNPRWADINWDSRCHTLSELQVKTMELLSRIEWSAGR